MTKSIVLGLALSLSAQAWARPTVKVTPENVAETTSQIRATFSEPVVALNQQGFDDAFAVSCTPAAKGTGHWEDTKTWTYDFDTEIYGNNLPGGTQCTVKMSAAFKAAKKVKDRTNFAFTIDGPNVLAIYPGERTGSYVAGIQEDQVVVLGFDTQIDLASLKANAYFKVKDMPSRVDISVLGENEMHAVMKSENYPTWIMEGVPYVVMVRPVTKLANGKKIDLVIDAGVKSSASGVARKQALKIPFESRQKLQATFSCTRENAQSGCSPFAPMELVFSEPIKMDQAKEIQLVSADGLTVIKAEIDPSQKGDATIGRLTFPAQYKDNQAYHFVLPAGIVDEDNRPLDNAQGIIDAKVATGDYPPLAKFNGEFGIIESADPILPATLRNLEANVIKKAGAPTQILGSSLRLDASNFKAVVRWLKRLDNRGGYESNYQTPEEKKNDARRKSMFADLSKQQVKALSKFEIPLAQNGKAFEVVKIDLKKSGFHVVELQSQILGKTLIEKDATMFVPTSALVTNMVVHSKWGRESSLFWVTALDSGNKVEGAQVVIHDCTGEAVWSGTTNTDGYVKVAGSQLNSKINLERCDYNKPDYTGSNYDNGFFVTAEKDGDFTFTHSGWQEGIEPFRFGYAGVSGTTTHGGARIVTHTVLDRTLFKVGERVGMKFFLRVPSGTGLLVPQAADLPNQVRIVNDDTSNDYVVPVSFRNDGTAELEWNIPAEAKLGSYSMTLEKKVGEEVKSSYYSWNSFSVLEFKVPLLKGSITFAKPDALVQPGNLEAKLSVTYMDGEPVRNENVKFRYTIREGWGRSFEGFEGFYFARNKVVVGQKSLTDDEESNITTFERPSRLDNLGSRIETISGLSNLDSIRDVDAQLEYVDKNGETQSVSRSVSVYPAAVLTAVSVKDALGSKKTINFQVAVADLNGKAVKGAVPSIQVYEQITYTHKTSMVGGFYTSSSTQEIKPTAAVIKCDAQTNVKGIMNCSAKVEESGSYIVQSSIRDTDGNVSYGQSSADVTGARMWFPASNSDRIDLVAEKKELQAGEDATFRVETEFANATVLVTVEREGVLDQFVQQLSTNDPRIHVKMKASYAPNVYVSALVVRGRIAQNQATATIDPGKPAYQIGLTEVNVNRAPNTLTVKVKALNQAGQETKKFKPRQTVKAEVTITKWAQGGQVPAAHAEFALAVIDKGLLQLKKNDTWNILDAMLGNRSLEVQTATAQMQVVGKRHYGVKAKPTGGDGAADLAALAGQSRELFDTRLTWIGRVVTDANGKAIAEFQTNDSPTEFVIVAIANADADKFGQGETSIVSQPDVQVLPAIGQVVRNGDVFAQEFTLRNTTTNALNATISGKVVFTKKDGSTETVEVPAKSASIGAQGDAFVSLGNVTVPEGAVSSKVIYTVVDQNGQVLDSIKLSQEVKPDVLPRVWAAQLNKVDAAGVNFPAFIPNDVKAGESLIKVQMLPTLAAGLSSVTDTLANYPYQSLELMVSRATATANQALWDDAMKRLPAHLDSNGLVTFYPNATQPGSEYLTAYIMSVANYSGMQIPEESLDKMIGGLTSVVEGRSRAVSGAETPAVTFARKVYAIEVLNRYGRAQAAWMAALPQIAHEQIPTITLIDLLSIYANMEIQGGAAKLEEVKGYISSRMDRTGTQYKFKAAQYPRYWFMLTSPDAEQLELLLVIAKNETLANEYADVAPLMVNAAVGQMVAGSWDLTVANAIGVLSFKAFAEAYEDGNVTGETKIALNTIEKAQWNWNEKSAGGVTPFAAQSGNTSVDLKHVGTGTPWAITSVIYAQPITEKKEVHIRVTKTVTPEKAVYKKGDEVTITLKIEPQTQMPMVAIYDPIPAGAKILGTGLDNDQNQGTVITNGFAWPDYEQKTYDAYNVSFYMIPPEGVTLAYKVQLNNAGKFKLPATRVEAIYAPENFAEVPNKSVEIQP